MNFNTHIFDGFGHTETLLLGLNATVKACRSPSRSKLVVCAAPVVIDLLPEIKPHLLESAVTICTPGGRPARYDPRTRSFSALFNVSAEEVFQNFGKAYHISICERLSHSALTESSICRKSYASELPLGTTRRTRI